MTATYTARILVADHDEQSASALTAQLERLHYVVIDAASDPENAIAKADTLRPDLVLMDVDLGGRIDGIDAAEVIRNRMNIPVILLCGAADDEMLDRARLVEPAAYLARPVRDRDLHSNIEIALHRNDVASQLRARDRWYPIALRAIGDAVIVTNADSHVVFVNPSAEQLTGWTTDECADRSIDDVLRLQEDAGGKPVAEPTKTALELQAVVHLPPGTVLVRRDGARVPVEDSAAPIFDDDGSLSGAVVVLRDVTVRRALDARIALSERLISLGTTVAGVAHEINNPLSLVVSNLGFLADQLGKLQMDLDALASSHPRAAASANRIRVLKSALGDAVDGADRVSRIVKDLRNLSRPDSRGKRPIEVWTAIDNALRIAANELRHRAQIVTERGAVPLVDADPSRLEQVLSNLLINAAHAIPEGKVMSNCVRVATSTAADGSAVITIEDTGAGIAPEHIARVFDPFFTTKPVGVGTGLGLSICHGIVADLGGTIVVESVVGKGAHFRIVLPGSRMPALASAPPTAIAPIGRGRVLVIDDEPGIVAALVRGLGDDHDVTGTTDPREALDLICKGPAFDMILCDLMMPAMTGMELFREVSTRVPAQSDRFLFLTGGAFSSQATEFLAAHPGRWMEKPFAVSGIQKQLVRWLHEGHR